MTIIFLVISVIVLGYILCGIWFGIYMMLDMFLQKQKLYRIMFFSELLSAAIPTIFVLIMIGSDSIRIRNLNNISIYMIAILTILLTVFIVLKADAPNRQKTAKEIFLSGLNGMMMEMPQRLMMQPFTWWLLQKFQVPNAEYYAVFTTAIIWCMGIVTQNVIGKQDFDRNLWIELLSSFVFSLGIGYVFQKSGFIVITMFAHFFERIIYQSISNRKAHT